MIKNDEFIEHAVFSGNHYGTSLKAMEEVVRTGKRPILDIDTQVSEIFFRFIKWCWERCVQSVARGIIGLSDRLRSLSSPHADVLPLSPHLQHCWY